MSTPALLSSLVPMVGFALAGAITPGPVNVLALRHGGRARRVALLYVLGASASYAAVVWCMGLGARQAMALTPALAPAAQWVCAAYLLWLAWRLARAPVSSNGVGDEGAALRPWRAFAQGAAVQALNPKAWLVALSGVGLFVLPHGTAQERALAWFCAVSLLACLAGVGCWALAGRALARWLCTAARQRLFHRVLAGLLAASVAGMILPR